MKIKRIFLCLLLLILISGCIHKENIPKSREYYSQLKNQDLDYTWDFKISFSENIGGHATCPDYFWLNNYILRGESLKISYEIAYKHEEGHLYACDVLRINNTEKFFSQKFDLFKPDLDSFRDYMNSVWEGIANYYVMEYFNNSMSRNYLTQIENEMEGGEEEAKKHYQGLKYINHSLSLSIYQNFTELILDWGSEGQYISYLNLSQKFV